MNIETAFREWQLSLQAERRTERTQQSYAQTMRPFLRWLAAHAIDDSSQLSAAMAREYILSAFSQLAPATQHGRVAVLKRFGAWLDEEGITEGDPFRRVKRPKLDRDELAVRLVTPVEAAAILGRLDQRDPEQFRDYVIIKLCLDVGLRRGEVVSARYADLDVEEGSLRVLGKGNKTRLVPLSDEMRLLLSKYVNRVRPRRDTHRSAVLFLSRRGTPLTGAGLYHAFQKHARAAGVVGKRFHDLRHTAVTWNLRQRMPKERVARMVGHASDTITSLYEHLDFEAVKEAHAEAQPLSLMEAQARSKARKRGLTSR